MRGRTRSQCKSTAHNVEPVEVISSHMASAANCLLEFNPLTVLQTKPARNMSRPAKASNGDIHLWPIKSHADWELNSNTFTSKNDGFATLRMKPRFLSSYSALKRWWKSGMQPSLVQAALIASKVHAGESVPLQPLPQDTRGFFANKAFIASSTSTSTSRKLCTQRRASSTK